MTKLYVVVEGNWQDYEGGGDDIAGIFSTYARAEAAVKGILKSYKKSRTKKNKNGQWVLSGRPSNSWIQIDEWDLDRDYLVDPVSGDANTGDS